MGTDDGGGSPRDYELELLEKLGRLLLEHDPEAFYGYLAAMEALAAIPRRPSSWVVGLSLSARK